MVTVMSIYRVSFLFFFFNDTATTEIYTLSLHDALPISSARGSARQDDHFSRISVTGPSFTSSTSIIAPRSEEHTSELQSQFHLVCRLLLEKKKKYNKSSIFLRIAFSNFVNSLQTSSSMA